MTDTIYEEENDELAPTWLMIKQHSITGMKYLCKTFRVPGTSSFERYKGSGTYWTNHIKKHGKEFVITTDVFGPYISKKLIKEEALALSEELDIVKSDEWANLIPETGLAGGWAWNKGLVYERDFDKEKSDALRLACSLGAIGREAPNKGKKLADMYSEERAKEISEKIGNAGKGREPPNKGIKTGIEPANKGKKEETTECPHCGKIGGKNVMQRNHFNNCPVFTGKKITRKSFEIIKCPWCDLEGEKPAMTRWHGDNCRHKE